MNSILVPLAAALLMFGAVLVGTFAFAEQRRRTNMRRTLAVVLGGPDAEADVLGQRTWSETSTIDAIVEALGTRLITARGRERLRHQLALAGRPASEPLKAVIGRKIIYLGVGLCLGLIAALVFGGWTWLIVPVAAAVGFMLPDFVLYNQGERRTDEIKLELPDALDLLNLCVESGLGLQAAFAKVAESKNGPVAQEFGRVLQEMQLGVSRAAAFESMARRTKQQDLQRFVSAMLQVDRLGIPVASVLREQAREMRATRHARAREQAQKVPVKILGPLMICFLPGLFVIVLGPAVINTMSALSGR
jgi:tight adherence protein C